MRCSRRLSSGAATALQPDVAEAATHRGRNPTAPRANPAAACVQAATACRSRYLVITPGAATACTSCLP